MKDILEYFPLKKYGAIALLFLFPFFSLYYYFAYFPFLATDNTFQIECDNSSGNSNNSLFVNSSSPGVITLSFSVPKFISNESEINVSIRNVSSENIENLKVALSSEVYFRRASITFESIIIEQLNREANTSKKIKIMIYGMRDGDPVNLSNFQIEFNNKIVKCELDKITRDSYGISTYNQLYAWILATLGNIPLIVLIIFALSIISCSINEDGTQDFPVTSHIGRYYIARIFFRASIFGAIFFIILYWATSSLINIWTSNYVPYVGILIAYTLFSIVVIKTLSRLIKTKPKAKIVIDASGKEKEIEILDNRSEFNLQKFLAEISKIKKR